MKDYLNTAPVGVPERIVIDLMNQNEAFIFVQRLMDILDIHKENVLSIRLGFSPKLKIPLGLLSQFPTSLRHLRLVSCGFDDEESCRELGEALMNMPHLTHIEIGDHHMGDHGIHIADALASTSAQSKIRHLSLGLNRFPVHVSSAVLLAMTGHTQLQELDVGWNNISGCISTFMQSPPPSLKSLDIAKEVLPAARGCAQYHLCSSRRQAFPAYPPENK